ncbi:MAG: sel1 repeat family protein [Gammaproteobacteria bacterium]|nr:sel1 repeat family protein [Gammaproteobacteria bacterium]MCF6231374.1 sel1 repeat family protein [Gammaproteobacteria bacterium]
MLDIKRPIALFILLGMAGCSPAIDSCLDDGISMAQVQSYLEQGRRDELLNQLQIRANSGEAASQYFLGFIYWSDEPEKSLEWFEASAENGCLEGVNYLAQTYLDGKVVHKNEPQAFYWYLRLAETGDHNAMKMVSHMYEIGQGVEKNLEQSREWATKSWQ